VVFGGEADVLRPRLDERRRPSIRVKTGWIELLVQRPVFALETVYVAVSIDPALEFVAPRPAAIGDDRPAFAAVPEGIDAPVKDDAELKTLEPFEAVVEWARTSSRMVG